MNPDDDKPEAFKAFIALEASTANPTAKTAETFKKVAKKVQAMTDSLDPPSPKSLSTSDLSELAELLSVNKMEKKAKKAKKAKPTVPPEELVPVAPEEVSADGMVPVSVLVSNVTMGKRRKLGPSNPVTSAAAVFTEVSKGIKAHYGKKKAFWLVMDDGAIVIRQGGDEGTVVFKAAVEDYEALPQQILNLASAVSWRIPLSLWQEMWDGVPVQKVLKKAKAKALKQAVQAESSWNPNFSGGSVSGSVSDFKSWSIQSDVKFKKGDFDES